MTQFLITALGSYGDVHPMVGLGSALVARGHRVKIFTSAYFEDVVTSAGLELVPLGSREDYVRLAQHPDLWHPIRGPKLVMTFTVGERLRPLFDALMSHYVPGDTVFCAHALDAAGRCAAEKLQAPLASIIFAPGVVWSLHDSPRLKGAFLGPRVPKWLKRFQFWAADRLFVLPLIGKPLNALRKELGLPPVQRVFGNWLHNTDLLLALFPDWFGPPQPDWPKNTHCVGFPLWDAPGSVPIFRFGKMGTAPLSLNCAEKEQTDPVAHNDDLQSFLATGPPPIAFSPGSANHEAHEFFDAAVAACNQLGCRGILLTKYTHQLPARLPDTVRHFGFVPMSQLLPRSAALVHHAGIGSCAQGLAAGIPQIVRPMSYDQFDNSRRLVELGVAQEISVKKFTGPRLAATLEPLLASPTVAARCRDLAARCNGPAALAAACQALEQLATLKNP